MPSKVLLEKATELGIKVKSHASLLTPGQADRLRAKFGGGKKLKAELEESKTAPGQEEAGARRQRAAATELRLVTRSSAARAPAEPPTSCRRAGDRPLIPALAETMPPLTVEPEARAAASQRRAGSGAAPRSRPAAAVASSGAGCRAREVEEQPVLEPVTRAGVRAAAADAAPPGAKRAAQAILAGPEVAPPVQRVAPKLTRGLAWWCRRRRPRSKRRAAQAAPRGAPPCRWNRRRWTTSSRKSPIRSSPKAAAGGRGRERSAPWRVGAAARRGAACPG